MTLDYTAYTTVDLICPVPFTCVYTHDGVIRNVPVLDRICTNLCCRLQSTGVQDGVHRYSETIAITHKFCKTLGMVANFLILSVFLFLQQCLNLEYNLNGFLSMYEAVNLRKDLPEAGPQLPSRCASFICLSVTTQGRLWKDVVRRCSRLIEDILLESELQT